MSMAQADDLEVAAALLSSHSDFRVLRRFVPCDRYHPDPEPGDRVLRGLYLDTETTGLDPEKHVPIEIGLVPFDFCQDGRIFRVHPAINQFEDPGVELSQEITDLTGITNAMVAGQAFDGAEIEREIAAAAVVIAHNAAFDRPMMERRFPSIADKHWACSISDIGWKAAGISSSKLAWIASEYGVFYDGHRAEVDCRVGVHLLAQLLPDGTPVLKALLDKARKPSYRLWATNSPFEQKDEIKARGYFWHDGTRLRGAPKAWWIEVDHSKVDEEIGWLAAHLYRTSIDRLFTGGRVIAHQISARTRYSDNIERLARWSPTEGA